MIEEWHAVMSRAGMQLLRSPLQLEVPIVYTDRCQRFPVLLGSQFSWPYLRSLEKMPCVVSPNLPV